MYVAPRTKMRALLTTGGLMLAAACQQPMPDHSADAAAAIRAADSAFSKAAEAKSLDQTVAFYSDDATLLPPDAPMLTTRDAIRKLFSDMMAAPGFSISWKPTRVEAAKSGDLGYSVGTYMMGMTGPDGKPAMEHGKYSTVWRKQADGSWKAVADMFSSDEPPAPPPAAAPAKGKKK